MHGSVQLNAVTTTTIESRAFADWDDATGAELAVSKILAAEKATPRRALRNPEIHLEFTRLVRMCQRATVAADPQNRQRVVANRIPGVRYVQCEGQTIYDLFFSTRGIEQGQPSMSLVRSPDGDWSLVL